MRLTHEQVKQGIGHRERLVRDAALRYFADSFSPDAGIMPLAIEVIGARGWRDAFRLDGSHANLAQTEETIGWAIDQLNRLGRPKAHEDLIRCQWLSHIIAGADVTLLMNFEERVLALEGLDGDYRDEIAERLRLTTLDTDSCWRELEKFCEVNLDDALLPLSFGHAWRLVEAIARDQTSGQRVLSVLGQHVKEDCPLRRLQGFAIEAAGIMRLDAAVPVIIAKLKARDGDEEANESAEAFARIGTDSTVKAMCDGFAAAPRHYRLAVALALGNIRSDLAVGKCAALADHEKNDEVKMTLAESLLLNFSVEGVAPARQLMLRGIDDLRRNLVAAATLMDVSFPEFEDWKQEEIRRDQDERRAAGWEPAAPAIPTGRTTKEKSAAAPSLMTIPNLMNAAPISPIISKPKVAETTPAPAAAAKNTKNVAVHRGLPMVILVGATGTPYSAHLWGAQMRTVSRVGRYPCPRCGDARLSGSPIAEGTIGGKLAKQKRLHYLPRP